MAYTKDEESNPPGFMVHYARTSVSHTVGNLLSPLDPADPGPCASQSRIRDTHRQDHVGAAAVVQREQVRRLDFARFKRDIPGDDARFPFRRKGFRSLAVPSRGIRHSFAGKPPSYPRIHQPVMNRRPISRSHADPKGLNISTRLKSLAGQSDARYTQNRNPKKRSNGMNILRFADARCQNFLR